MPEWLLLYAGSLSAGTRLSDLTILAEQLFSMRVPQGTCWEQPREDYGIRQVVCREDVQLKAGVVLPLISIHTTNAPGATT
jgi:hypothetical protein